MNTDSPIRVHTKKAKLSNGDEVEIVGSVYDKPIFPAGEIVVYNCITIVRGDLVIGSAFFQNTFNEQELKDKVEDISANADQYLYPGIKAEIYN